MSSRELSPEWVLSSFIPPVAAPQHEMSELIAIARRLWPSVQAHAYRAVSYTHLDVYKRQGLNDRDFVQKPIRSAVLGNMLRAVGVENVAVNRVSIPVVAAGELRQFGFAESLRRHDVPLSF